MFETFKSLLLLRHRTSELWGIKLIYRIPQQGQFNFDNSELNLLRERYVFHVYITKVRFNKNVIQLHT